MQSCSSFDFDRILFIVKFNLTCEILLCCICSNHFQHFCTFMLAHLFDNTFPEFLLVQAYGGHWMSADFTTPDKFGQ